MKMISIVTFSCLALVAGAMIDEAQARGCSRAGRFSLTSAGPWPMRLRALEGEACNANFRSYGPMIYRRLYLVSSPQHGNIQLIEGGRYRYSAQAGYRGADSFMLRVCGTQNGYEGCADLQYAVTIE